MTTLMISGYSLNGSMMHLWCWIVESVRSGSSSREVRFLAKLLVPKWFLGVYQQGLERSSDHTSDVSLSPQVRWLTAVMQDEGLDPMGHGMKLANDRSIDVSVLTFAAASCNTVPLLQLCEFVGVRSNAGWVDKQLDHAFRL